MQRLTLMISKIYKCYKVAKLLGMLTALPHTLAREEWEPVPITPLKTRLSLLSRIKTEKDK